MKQVSSYPENDKEKLHSVKKNNEKAIENTPFRGEVFYKASGIISPFSVRGILPLFDPPDLNSSGHHSPHDHSHHRNCGFIGFHTAKTLLERGESIVGIDCVTDYYDPHLKENRLAILKSYPGFTEERFSITDLSRLASTFKHVMPQKVIHLAAQAGVRYSVEHPLTYGESNLTGFLHILECCRHHRVQHLVYASTSSVYGANQVTPFRETDGTAHPLSLVCRNKASKTK